jgi:photosystem II stability/assembly factor-like uncharacterized protein
MSGVVAAGGDLIYTGRYVSTDGGRTWTRNDQGIAAGDARFGLVAQNLPGRGSGLRLVALNNSPDSGPDGLFRSHGGRRWRRLPLAAPRSVIDAGAPIVVAVGEAVVRSEDGGDTWRVVSSAPPYASGLRSNLTRPEYLVLHAFEANDELGDVALWTSDDAGATWRRSSEGLPTACVHVTAVDVCPGFSAYAVDPFDSKRRWIATQGSIFYHPPLFISTDAGASWHVQTEALPDVLALAADPQVKDRLLAGTSSGLFVSEDGGEHWRTLGNGLPDSAAILHFAHDARVATWYAATAERGIYRSLDSGANWTLLPDAPNLEYPAITVDPRTPGALLAAFRAQGVWLWTP